MGRFTDTAGHPFEASIERIAKAGIMVGYGDGTFRPAQKMTDEEIDTVLTRMFKLDLKNLTRAEAADALSVFLEDVPVPDGRMDQFPVQGSKPRDFMDTWGAPRPGGATHKGVDIFCGVGTPLLACEAGAITKIGDSTIGGLRLWISARWYYAHLQRYAQGMAVGVNVTAGQVVGYANNTGDAKWTPCHLHFGWDPNGTSGNAWANPYTMLRALLPY